jgi:acyl-CoA synthetase (AMP-forming)/AMP-acid ligase II
MMTLVDFVCRGAGAHAFSGADGRVPDHAALCNAADAIGSALAARGVEPGDLVGAALTPGTAFAASLIGAAAIRAALAPLPPLADEASARGVLRSRKIRALLAGPEVSPAVRAAAAAHGIPVLIVGFDERGLALVDGEHVFESHARIAEPGDVAFVPAGGEPLTQAALVLAAGDRGLEGLLDAVTGAAASARRAA